MHISNGIFKNDEGLFRGKVGILFKVLSIQKGARLENIFILNKLTNIIEVKSRFGLTEILSTIRDNIT